VASAPAPAPFRFRALSLSELLDEAFRIYRRYFQVMVGIAVLLLLPTLLTTLVSGSYRVNLASAFTNLARDGYSQQAFQRLQDQQAQVNQLWSLLGGLLTLILLPFTVGALYRVVADAVLGRPLSIGSVLRETLARYWALLGVVILTGLALIAAVVVIAILIAVLPPVGVILLLAAIPLAVFVGIRWTVSLPALLVEGIGPVMALSRSWYLVGGSWWRVVGILLLAALMRSVIGVAIGGVLGGIAGLVPGIGEDVRLALVTAATTLTGALISPIFPLVITLIYFDLRVRKEGFDLEQLARETNPGLSPA
jgi:hypothetical protein